jgi:PAS domain S-box-containing protein
VTGYSRKELLGRNYRLFLKESENEQFEKIWNEVTKEKVYEGVVRRTRPTGEETWLVSTFSPVVDETGMIYKVYFMGFDITEKKLKYQLLEDANQEIERLRNRLKDYET